MIKGKALIFADACSDRMAADIQRDFGRWICLITRQGGNVNSSTHLKCRAVNRADRKTRKTLAYRQTDSQPASQPDRQTDRQTDTESERQRVRKTDGYVLGSGLEDFLGQNRQRFNLSREAAHIFLEDEAPCHGGIWMTL